MIANPARFTQERCSHHTNRYGFAMQKLPERADTASTPDRVAAGHELRERVETLVSTLPERFRLPVLLHYFHGMSQAEIAHVLDERPRTVSDRIAFCLWYRPANLTIEPIPDCPWTRTGRCARPISPKRMRWE